MKSRLALMMAISMVAGAGTNAFAASDTGKTTTSIVPINAPATAPQEVRSILEGLATVEKINEDKQITVKIDTQTIVLNLGEGTLWIDAKTGIPSSIKDVKVGDQLYVFYSAAMTRSLPPQSSAAGIVTNIQKDQSIPKLMTVKEMVSTKEDQIRFLNTNGDMIVTVTKDTPITPFKTKQIVSYKDIQPGTKLFVYYDIVLESYPGQTGATKVVLVGTEAEAVKMPTKIMINGKAIDLGKLTIVERGGNYMVPLKAVSSALGFSLKWDAKTKTASIDNGVAKTSLSLGQDSYFKASSKAIGLTAPFAYGAAPEIIKGSLYVPVKLFNLLYSNEETVTINGDTIQINTTVK